MPVCFFYETELAAATATAFLVRILTSVFTKRSTFNRPTKYSNVWKLNCVILCRNLKVVAKHVDRISSLVEISLSKYYDQPEATIHSAALGCVGAFNWSVSIFQKYEMK